jgi:hypothetical protein
MGKPYTGGAVLRNIAAFFAGFLTLGAVVVTLQQLSALIYPFPADLDLFDPAAADAIARHFETMPPAAWIVAMLSEVLGAFAGALVAGWIGRGAARPLSGAIVGMALMGSLFNWSQFEHPMWYIVGQLVLYPAGLMIAWALFAKRPPAEAEGRSG